MKLKEVIEFIDSILKPHEFEDVSNNGLQIECSDKEIKKVAFAVDASLKSVKAAAEAGADLLVVHHGLSWGGGLKRITKATYAIVKTAIDADLAVAGYHLPLDANEEVGNNWELARERKLERITPAFSYHGNVIGVVGYTPEGKKVGICSGGAGEFAVRAKELDCDEFITGEANWAEVIAAENVGAPLTTLGHYETETYGVKALSKKIAEKLGLETIFVK